MDIQKDPLTETCGSLAGRILAIDWGARRMGLAVSDPLGLTAQGLPTLERRNERSDLSYLMSLLQRYEVSLIVLGNPLNMDGTEGSQSAKARQFAAELSRSLKIEVRLWDERLTTVQAHRVLQESGMKQPRRVQEVDRLAAVLLLQNFLESQRAARPKESEEA